MSEITIGLMEKLFSTKNISTKKNNLVTLPARKELVKWMNFFLPKYGINNQLRFCAFLGNCGIESAYFRTTTEYATGKAYEYRSNLGNHFKNDGVNYKGRDLTQTTGRYNYWRVVCRFVKNLTGKDFAKDENKYDSFKSYLASGDYDKLLKEADRLDCNFLRHPDKLAEIKIAVESACIFWEQNNLSSYADKGQFKQLSGIVNRGDKNKTALHWSERNTLYNKCLKGVPANFKLQVSTANPSKVATNKDNPIPNSAKNSIETAVETTDESSLNSEENSSLNSQPGETQIAENIINNEGDKVVPDDFVPEDKTENAPPKENSTTKAAQATILGFGVPAFLLTIFSTIKSSFEQGYLDASQVAGTVINYIVTNTHYLFFLIALIIILLIVKKLVKQITLWIQMFINANPNYHNIKVVAQNADDSAWWQFWKKIYERLQTRNTRI